METRANTNTGVGLSAAEPTSASWHRASLWTVLGGCFGVKRRLSYALISCL